MIFRHTPDKENLITTTDSKLLCRLVGRWVGQGGKTSLVNTTYTDILEYILTNLVARIETRSRTFVVKVKTHRGEPLNEGSDNLVETGRAMEKERDNYRWKERTTRVVYSYYDRNLGKWKKSKWTKTIRNTARRGETESQLEEGEERQNL